MSTWVLIYILTTPDGVATNKVEDIKSAGACMLMGNDVKRAAENNTKTIWASFTCNSKG